MDKIGSSPAIRRSQLPNELASTYADLDSTRQKALLGTQANLAGVHDRSRMIGRPAQATQSSDNNPLQRWNSQRREQSVRRTQTKLISSAEPGVVSIKTPAALGTDRTTSLAKNTEEDSGSDNQTGTPVPTTDTETESDTDSKLSSADSDDSDEEFGNLHHPRIDPRTRAGLEALIFEGKTLTTLSRKKEWEEAKRREDLEVRRHRGSKYAHDLAAGAINQLTSFGVGGIVAAAAGTPWVFPFVSAVLSDMVGDRLAQLIRQSTVIPTASKEHFEHHRQLARALGDSLAGCMGKEQKKKFMVVIGTDAQGQPIHTKMTAKEALAHAGWTNVLNAWGNNLLARGLPFLWFTAIYTARDYYLTQQCGPVFFPNRTDAPAGMFEVTNSSKLVGCPAPEAVNVDALRWGLSIIGGMLSGAMTMFSNQLISSFLPGVERTNYSASTWKLQASYLENARTDTKQFLDSLQAGELSVQFGRESMDASEIADLAKAAQVLSQIQEKELTVARKKASAWTTYIGELDQATQKHRDETLITPEFTGKRLDTGLSILGKMLSLLAYAYTVSAYSSLQDGDEQEKLAAVFMVPLTLIVIGGYMWRDDLRLVGHVPYGIVKGAMRGRGREKPDGAAPDIVISNPTFGPKPENDDSNGYDAGNAEESENIVEGSDDR